MVRDIKKKSEFTGSELDCLFGFNPDSQNGPTVPSAEELTRTHQVITDLEDPSHRGIDMQSLSIDQPQPTDAEIIDTENSQRYVIKKITDIPEKNLAKDQVISISKETECAKHCTVKDKRQLAIRQLLTKQRTAKNLIAESEVNLVMTKRNTMDLFIVERCNIGTGEWTLFTPLWEAYKDWVKENGINEPLNYQEFLGELRRRGYRPGGKLRGNRIRRGISLKPPGTEVEVEVEVI